MLTTEEYIDTLEICGKTVKVGLDDYGQCYFLEYEEDGKTVQEGCGTYNSDYVEYAYFRFDPEYRNLRMTEVWAGLNADEAERLRAYLTMFDTLSKRVGGNA